MLTLIGAVVAGALTTLAPCVLPLLPVIVGGSVVGGESQRQMRNALIITLSLATSIMAFTLLLKFSTALIDVPQEVWSAISGGLLMVLGLVTMVPWLWERVEIGLRLQERSTGGLAGAREREGTAGLVLTGAALGPVFSSCSPMYGYVIVTVLPSSFGWGFTLLLAYCLGLAAALLLVALLGQRIVARLGWASNPRGWFRRGIGLVFVLVGVAVVLGLDRDLQAWVIENSPVAPWELDEGFIPE